MKILNFAFALLLASCVHAVKKYKHLHVIRGIFDNLLNPNNMAIVYNQTLLPEIFDENVRGWHIPFGRYEGLHEALDYWYGNSPRPSTNASYEQKSYVVRQYAEDGISVSATIDLLQTPLPGKESVFSPNNLTFVGFYQFTNDTDKATINYWSVILPRATEFFETRGLPYDSTPFQDFTISKICAYHDDFCVPVGLSQFDSTENCKSFMRSIRFGPPDNGYANTTICRYIHAPIAEMRPAIHCPHIGPSGGGFCKDHSYREMFTDQYNDHGVNVPYNDIIINPDRKE